MRDPNEHEKISLNGMICNPFETKTWKRTGLALLFLFGFVLGVSIWVENKKQHAFKKSRNTDTTTNFSYKSKEYQMNKAHYMARHKLFFDLIKTNFSDFRDLILPSTPQYKALQWIVYKDTVIQLQEHNESSVIETDTTTTDHNGISLMKRFSIDDENYQRLQQRYATMVLYYALCGENWKKGTDTNETEVVVDSSQSRAVHLYNVSECNFLGFHCRNSSTETFPLTTDHDGVERFRPVVSFNLDGYNLAGQLPREIGLLSDLTLLNLANNNLVGTIPESMFEKLTNLGKSDHSRCRQKIVCHWSMELVYFILSKQ
jgi:hypothetical protein